MPLKLSSFEGCDNNEEWSKLLLEKCKEKYAASPEEVQATIDLHRKLWDRANEETLDDGWIITAEDVLDARANMKKNKAGGCSGMVT